MFNISKSGFASLFQENLKTTLNFLLSNHKSHTSSKKEKSMFILLLFFLYITESKHLIIWLYDLNKEVILLITK